MRVMLIGRTGCGKTTLAQMLNNEVIEYKKTQMILYEGEIIDTPGEYLENRNYYKALSVASIDVDVVFMLQSADDEESLYPPNFIEMFQGKEIYGIITKTDLNPDTERANKFLEYSGVEKIYTMNSLKNSNIEDIKKILNMKE